MKYLVEVRAKQGGGRANLPQDEAANIGAAAKAYIQDKVADGTIDCSYFVGHGGHGIAIMNADSHEQLMRDIHGYPTAPFLDFTVAPLVDAEVGWDILLQRS